MMSWIGTIWTGIEPRFIVLEDSFLSLGFLYCLDPIARFSLNLP